MRYLAVLLGIFVLPGKAIYDFAAFFITFPFAGAFVAIVAAFATPFAAIRAGSGLLSALFWYTPLTVLGLAVTLVTQYLGSIILFPVDIVRTLMIGLQAAYRNGFHGLTNVLDGDESYRSRFVSYVGNAFRDLVNKYIPNYIPAQAGVAPVQHVVEPDLVDEQGLEIHNNARLVADPGMGNRLTLNEKAAAGALGNPYLNNLVERYNFLETRLNLVRVDLPLTPEQRTAAEQARNQESPLENDELLAMEVNQPILFVKQYQDNNGVWRCVPRMSHITDGPNLRQTFDAQGYNQRHPLSNNPTADLIAAPRPHNIGQPIVRPTRFVWHRLTAQACNSQELNEIAAEVRTLIPAQAAVQRAEVEPPVLPSPLNTAAVTQNKAEPGLVTKLNP